MKVIINRIIIQCGSYSVDNFHNKSTSQYLFSVVSIVLDSPYRFLNFRRKYLSNNTYTYFKFELCVNDAIDRNIERNIFKANERNGFVSMSTYLSLTLNYIDTDIPLHVILNDLYGFVL